MIMTVSEEAQELLTTSSVSVLGYTLEEIQEEFHGINGFANAFYSTLEWGIRSAEILKRDSFICRFCGDKYANYVHHIRSLRIFPEICLHPDFLITVCVSCHNHLHRKGAK